NEDRPGVEGVDDLGVKLLPSYVQVLPVLLIVVRFGVWQQARTGEDGLHVDHVQAEPLVAAELLFDRVHHILGILRDDENGMARLSVCQRLMPQLEMSEPGFGRKQSAHPVVVLARCYDLDDAQRLSPAGICSPGPRWYTGKHSLRWNCGQRGDSRPQHH